MESVSAELECPTCGFTQADFKKTGRLGCSTCYTVFAEPLEGMLNKCTRARSMSAKCPRRYVRSWISPSSAIRWLSLQKAIETENYEEAARYAIS